MSEESLHENPENTPANVHGGTSGVLFALVSLIPKFLALRRKPRAWLAIRLALAGLGAALVIAPLGPWSGRVTALVGLLLFLIAILLGSSRADKRMDDRARELGALMVVNGGRYEQFGGRALEVRMFIGSENIWVLDLAQHPLLVIPVQKIVCVRAGQSLSGCSLWIEWGAPIAEFSYEGFFARHRARVAESAIRGILRPSVSVTQPGDSGGA